MSTKAGWKPIPHSQSWFCIYQSLPILAKLQSREHLRRKVQECLFQWSLHKNFLWKLLNLFSNHHLKTLLGIVHCKTANWSLDKERIIWRVKSIGYQWLPNDSASLLLYHIIPQCIIRYCWSILLHILEYTDDIKGHVRHALQQFEINLSALKSLNKNRYLLGMALPWLPAMLYYFCTSFILLYVLLTILIQYYELVLKVPRKPFSWCISLTCFS